VALVAPEPVPGAVVPEATLVLAKVPLVEPLEVVGVAGLSLDWSSVGEPQADARSSNSARVPGKHLCGVCTQAASASAPDAGRWSSSRDLPV